MIFVPYEACLYKIQEKLTYLSIAPEYLSIKNLQINYLQLCAFLQDMSLKVDDFSCKWWH